MDKGQLSMNVIIISAIGLLVLVILVVLIINKVAPESNFNKFINENNPNISTLPNIPDNVSAFVCTDCDYNGLLGVRTKTSNCSFDYLPLPDPECTTGAIFPNLTKDDICWSGYSASVRDVSESLKNQVYESYNVERIPNYAEVDHCCSLALGGNNDISNLWIEPYNITFGARVKDRVENCLHRLVCDGDMPLQQAQYDVCHNWTKYLKENGGTC